MSLDLSPDQFRILGYQAIDLLAEQLAAVRDTPARRALPEELRAGLLGQPLPEAGCAPEEVLAAAAQRVLPYPMGNTSPRFFAWVNSPAAPLGVLSELLAAGMNPSVAGGDHAATYVEHAVLGWLKQLVGYPADSGAILASGGSMANLIGLAAMRFAMAQGQIRAQGFAGEAAPMVVYTSTQGHSCIEKAVELLGIGHDYLRKVPVDADYRMDMGRLRAAIAADRAAGLRPVCVAASAGTVNTGAIDLLAEVADLCAAEGLWFHVDGAYGGVGVLAAQTAGRYHGLERADSLAIDPHKWLYMPVECGCAFVRDAGLLRNTFSLTPPYLRDDASLPWFAEFGPQQTRGFRALKLWMTMQQIGVQGYRELISRDIELARALQARIRERADFELIAAGALSITCFRYAPPSAQDLDSLNRRLLDIVQREGQVFLTSTQLDGKLVLRACIVNFRTSEADLDFLLDTLAEAGQRALG
jgi:glutamate/tyrosine decarboxylase-like PLP-dependent enzyme